MSDLQQWAEWFGISVKQVNRWCAAGIIPASRSSPRQHWKAPFTAEARQAAYARVAEKKGQEAADAQLLRPFINASRFLESPAFIAKRAQVYATAAAIDRAAKGEPISHTGMDNFRYVTRHWLKRKKNAEAEKNECLSADPAYRKMFPSPETYDYACKNPKVVELVAAFMLAINASNAGEIRKLPMSAVRSEWHKVIGQKPAHGQPRYVEADDCFRLNRADPSPAAFYRRFSKGLIRQAAREAAKRLDRGSVEFEGMDGESKDIAIVFDEANIQPAKPTASKFPDWPNQSKPQF